MILEAIITAFAGIVNALFALLPTWTPIDLSGAVADLSSGPAATVFAGLGWVNNYVPVDTMLALVAVQFAVWAGVYVLRMTLWVLSLFHITGNS